MANQLDKANTKFINRTYSMLALLIAVFLNHTLAIFNVNTSASDFFCILFFIYICLINKLIFPQKPTVFFLVLTIVVWVASTIYMPYKLGNDVNIVLIIANYLKLVLLFIYFLIGYRFSSDRIIFNVLKWYSLVAVIIGLIGILLAVFNMESYFKIMFIWGTRFKGLMNDPNYFAVHQVTAIAILSRISSYNTMKKIILCGIVFITIMATGSKTGVITLAVYIIVRALEYLICSDSGKKIMPKLLTIIFLVLLVVLLRYKIYSVMLSLSAYIPALSRVGELFVNFNDAISGGGSNRFATWSNALSLIKLSPIIGIGVGTYSNYAEFLFGSRAVAHNTYLQIAVEWGLVLALFFIIFLMKLLLNLYLKTDSVIVNIMKDIILIYLVGSFGISLNNARLFWLVLGALYYCRVSFSFYNKYKFERGYKN